MFFQMRFHDMQFDSHKSIKIYQYLFPGSRCMLQHTTQPAEFCCDLPSSKDLRVCLEAMSSATLKFRDLHSFIMVHGICISLLTGLEPSGCRGSMHHKKKSKNNMKWIEITRTSRGLVQLNCRSSAKLSGQRYEFRMGDCRVGKSLPLAYTAKG